MTQVEQQLDKLMSAGNITDAKQLSLKVISQNPRNQLANHSLIQCYFRLKQFESCHKQCLSFLANEPQDELSAKFIILSLIECRKFAEANNNINHFLSVIGPNVELFLLQAEVAVCLQDFEKALDVYKALYDFSPEFFESQQNRRGKNKQHFLNVRNLLKRNAFLKMQPCMGGSSRLDRAINCFFGLETNVQNDPSQRGSFFNIPQLTAKPYYLVDEVPGLQRLVDDIMGRMPILKTIISNVEQDNYVDIVESKNMQSDWQILAKKWQSIHILKAGRECKSTTEIKQVEQLLNNQIIADCPPHAPEAFISILSAGTFIPPHHGLSNVKLTVHIPIDVDELSSLTVGGERKAWHDNNVIIFDDSFLHSAENNSSDARTVFIFDIWHPDLSIPEREAIKMFMKTYDVWSAKYAKFSKAVQ